MLEILPGLTRIYEAWAERHPDVQPLTVQFAPQAADRDGDGAQPEGLHGVLAYPLEGHWLLVSFGLTELGEKTSGEKRVSGAGFEFTCRIPRAGGDEEVPAWILRVLHALAEGYIAGADLDVGHWITTPSPLGGEPANGAMTSLVIVPDVDLQVIDTANGVACFFQLVGLFAGEAAQIESAGTATPHVSLLRSRDPRLLTDPSREPALL
ncbi:suppressor of fused domain protein [Nocardiopsis coralliicola]